MGYLSASAYFENILSDYSGTANITDARLKALNNDYFNNKCYISNYSNMKAVAYMLDKNEWSVYAGEHAEYAIGGPSIELFIKSFNEKYGTSYTTQAENVSGYSKVGQLIKTREPYVITDYSNAYGMWIASPSSDNINSILYVFRDGMIDPGDVRTSTLGFRPVVCLKSETELEKNDDGSYTIVSEGTNERETLEKIEILMPPSVGVNYGETVRVTASNAQEDYTYHVYKANSLTGNGEEVKHSRLSISISGSVLKFTITDFIEQDEGYYYLVVETPDGLKESTSRTHIYFTS